MTKPLTLSEHLEQATDELFLARAELAQLPAPGRGGHIVKRARKHLLASRAMLEAVLAAESPLHEQATADQLSEAQRMMDRIDELWPGPEAKKWPARQCQVERRD